MAKIDPASLDWGDLRAFLEIVRTSSLPQASRTLGLSQATVGRRLQRLERVLGMRLFDRQPNRLVLTALGQELADTGSVMRSSAEAIARRASLSPDPADLPVRVTATGSISLFLALHARRLTDLATPYAITVLTTRVPLDLVRGEAEIALRMRRLPDAGPLASRRLGQVAFTMYAARALLKMQNSNDAWFGLDIVGMPERMGSSPQAGWLDEMAAARNSPIRMRIEEVAMRQKAAQAGAGAALLPCFLGDSDPALARVIDPPSSLLEDVYLLMHEKRKNTAPQRTIADALVRVFEESEDALRGHLPSVG